MTIEDPVQYSSLILKSPLSFYHAKIPDKHWQLRSLLCSPAPNTLYYPTGNNIYSLDTATRRRELVATLPFAPICLGARYGWVCAGGVENGHFASIRVGDNGKPKAPQVSQLGGLIVNSITLHRPPPGPNGEQDVLAILTNNDKTVRIYSLTQNRIQATLHLPIPTNHASISPNGKHLVVVGDSTKVYFYHSDSETAPNREAGRESWTLSTESPLIAGTMDALISTSFSPCSVMCAVASQDGSITIFDTRYLPPTPRGDPSPIIKKIPSSRPRTYAGAVRSVQFSPAPWDLLVWAEHSGRISIADTRSNFIKRQIIDVLSDQDKILDVEVQGVEEDDVPQIARHGIQRRRTISREEGSRGELGGSDEMEGYFHGQVTGHEDVSPILAQDSTTPTYTPSPGPTAAVNYMHPRYFMRNMSNIAPITLPTVSPVTVSAPTSYPGIGTPITTTSSLLRDYRERQIERDRARRRITEASRRESHSTEHSTSPPAPQPLPTSTSTHREVITHHTGNTSRPVHWRIDYEAQRRPVEEINQLQRNSEQLSQMIAEERRRNLMRRMSQSDSSSNGRSTTIVATIADRGAYDSSEIDGEDVVDITGCTLSVDGSKLYVATSRGIVEYKIDLAERKVFPDMTLR